MTNSKKTKRYQFWINLILIVMTLTIILPFLLVFISSITDAVWSFPTIILALAITTALGPGLTNVLIAIGIVFTSLMHPSKGLINTVIRGLGMTGFQPKWLTDTRIAMLSICAIEIWKWSGYTMMILLAGMQNISRDYYEAAIVDGATKWQQFRNITLPLLMASVNNVVVLSIIGGLKVFDIVVATTGGGPGYATEVFNTMIYNSYSYQKYGEATAGTTLLAVIILVITLCTYQTIAKNEVEL